MLVLMALVTTATTAPILWAVWLRHHKRPEADANGFEFGENYLTLSLDREYLDTLGGDSGFNIEDMVGDPSVGRHPSASNFNKDVDNDPEQPKHDAPNYDSGAVDADDVESDPGAPGPITHRLNFSVGISSV